MDGHPEPRINIVCDDETLEVVAFYATDFFDHGHAVLIVPF